MKTAYKKFISQIMALVLIVGLLPKVTLPARALDISDTHTLSGTVNETVNITGSGDADSPVVVTVDETVTLNCNIHIKSGHVKIVGGTSGGTLLRGSAMTGNNVTPSDTLSSLIIVEDGTLTLQDVTLDGNKASVTANSPLVTLSAYLDDTKHPKLVLNSGAILQNNYNYNDGHSVSYSAPDASYLIASGIGVLSYYSTITINTGSVIRWNTSMGYGGAIGEYNYGITHTVNMSGGEIYGNLSGALRSGATSAVQISSNGSLSSTFNMSGGEIYGNMGTSTGASKSGAGVSNDARANAVLNFSGSAQVTENYWISGIDSSEKGISSGYYDIDTYSGASECNVYANTTSYPNIAGSFTGQLGFSRLTAAGAQFAALGGLPAPDLSAVSNDDNSGYYFVLKNADQLCWFVPVAGISAVPAAATEGVDLTLSGTVSPADATNQTITWSIDASNALAGAAISDGKLVTTAPGTAKVLATVTDGAGAGDDYTEVFSITVSSGVSVTLGDAALSAGKYYYTGAAVTGSNIKTILLSFSGSVTPGDAITLPTAAGFTASGTSNAYNKRINIADGTQTSAVEDYLRGVGFAITSATQSVSVTVTTENITTDTFYYTGTQHYYQFIPYSAGTTGTWTNAYQDAHEKVFLGRTGYLATITNKAEDQFLYELSSGATGWLGGTTLAPGTQNGNYYTSFDTSENSDHWYWACGPEIGAPFYTVQEKNATSASDSVGAGYYFNWGPVEPNSANVEQCLTTLLISTLNGYDSTVTGFQTTAFSWNNIAYDRAYSADGRYYARGYFVEYGDQSTGNSGSGGDTFSSASGSFSQTDGLSLALGTFSGSSSAYQFPNLTVSMANVSNLIGAVTICADTAAASGETITLPADPSGIGGAPTVLTDLNGLTKTVVFASAQAPSAVQTYLRQVVFAKPMSSAQTVTITADANTTALNATNIKLTAYYNHPDNTTHYYGYVTDSLVNWVEAYNAAKSMTFMGMSGYLPTITSSDENDVLTNISTVAAWSGGTRLVFNGNNSTEDNAQICNQSSLDIGSFTKADADEKDSFYWACGPEAGLTYSSGKTRSDLGFGPVGTAYYSEFAFPWSSVQPDNWPYGEGTTEPCMQVNCIDAGSYKWNDLPLFLDLNEDEKRNYFVEFGGYTGSTDAIKRIANDPGNPVSALTASASSTAPAAYSITYHLDGAANPDDAPASYIYGAGATLPAPTKSGYSFGGWYADSDFSGSAVTTVSTTDTGDKEYWARWTAAASSHSDLPAKTITVTETSSGLFSGSSGSVLAQANMTNAFSASVEVKVTDTAEEGASFGFGAGTDVYPFDISLYIKGTSTKTKPASGYAVTISLPIPETLLDVREKLFIVHKSDDGTVTTLASSLKQVGGVWYLIFSADEFSPYALAVSSLASYDTAAGLPYYLDGSGNRMFIGFAADGKYLAPDGVTVLFTPNPKRFTDISAHWGKTHIDFVSEREIFVGTGTNVFSPDTGMTRAMLAAVIGRLYERSYGEISVSDVRAFTDCRYSDYYGKYVNWAAENGILKGVGGGLFEPDRPVRRQEMAAMLCRFAEFLKLPISLSTDTALRYTDTSGIASWAQDAALYCQETGLITGRSGGRFAPAETATRAEVAAIIERFVKLKLK